MRKYILLAIGLLLVSCGHSTLNEGNEEIAISRCLEKAIETGEKIVAQRDLIESVALTAGGHAAIELQEELHYRASFETFWEYIEEAERISRQVKDTLKQREIIMHIQPYANRVIELKQEILQ